MDGLLPLDSAASELLRQGLLGTIIVFLIWVIGRREQEIKDIRNAFEVKLAEKDKTILQLQESRLVESKAIVEVVTANNDAMRANKQGIDSLMPILQKIAGGH